jgi:hypothetical protein
MVRSATFIVAVLAAILLLPSAAHAQASIAGQVKDASGAVLPGVTVEAASAALIEKVRTAVTDGGGQYRIELLPPGTYTITFTLPGFNTVKREGILLSGSFTATVEADMRVGAIEETITVTGETPLVDVQSQARQRVMDRELIDTLPTGRTPFAMTALIPGVSVSAANQDVGGATLLSGAVQMQVHGSTGNSTMIMENGLSTAALVGAWGSQLAFNMAASQEVAVDYSGAGADQNAAGVKMNVIPREGGNVYNGTLFMNGTGGALQGSNFSQRLQDAGLRTPDSIRKLFDVNPGFGGPLQQDRVWFYFAARYAVTSRYAAGEFYDKNFNNPSVWIYDPDLSRPVSNDSDVKDARLRLTWQAAPRIKIGGSYQQQTARNWPSVRDNNGAAAGVTSIAYEASPYHYFPLERQVAADVTSPITNRLLIDGAIMHKVERAIRNPVPELSPLMIGVLDQATGRQYRAKDTYINRPSYQYVYRASASYITGAHAFKIGMGDIVGHFDQRDFDNNPVSYRFNNGVPNQITMRAYPIAFRVNVSHQFGAYLQDRWTANRLTLNLGLRHDWFKNSFPAQSIGPAPLAPSRNFSFDETDGLSLHDLNPKLGAAYDLTGNGKTALKVSLNRYVEPYTVNGIAGTRNPINRLVNSTTRSWADANRNYVPECNLLDLNANGECGAAANRNFGTATPDTNFDPALLTGFGNREYNWEFSGGVQREILPRVSADVSYFRRWYGNASVTDNRAVSASDYNTFSIVAPSDPRLPDGGGYTIAGLYDVVPARFGLTDNYLTFAKNFGSLVNRWDGVALSMNARLQNGLTVQGGVDAGRQTYDVCEVRAQIPEYTVTGTGINAISPNNPWCHTERPQAQFKLLGSYLVPKIGVQVSSTFQSIPGPEIAATFTATNAVITPSLGRPLSGGAANINVNLVEPGTMYGERLNQLDFRFGKVVRFGGSRAMFSLDLYNALNVDTVLTLNNAFATWQRPQSVMLARFAKIGVQLDF